MNLSHPTNRGRRAFTLIELLVVLVIIGILAALIGVAVSKAMAAAKRVRNRTEVGNLEVALGQFYQRFGVYPPSRLKLCEQFGNYNLANQFDADSVAFLTKLFPNIDMTIWNANTPGVGINWNGNKDPITGSDLIAPNAVEPSASVILEGDQCLVFCLGGIPGWSAVSVPANSGVPPNCLGFSANPKNPALTGNPITGIPQDGDRIGPFFEFQSSRLVVLQPPVVAASSARSLTHYSYLDTYGTSDGLGGLVSGAPLAYFSSYRQVNGYNRYYVLSGGTSDCPTLRASTGPGDPGGVWPYAESVSATGPKYLKPNSFQLISAGGDLAFGSGSIAQSVNAQGTIIAINPTWTPATAPGVYPTNSPGYDDQSNFTSATLGVGQD